MNNNGIVTCSFRFFNFGLTCFFFSSIIKGIKIKEAVPLKNSKRILALLTAIVLIVLCLVTILLAIFGDPENPAPFRIAFGCLFILPVFLFIGIAAYKWKHQGINPWLQEQESEEEPADKP